MSRNTLLILVGITSALCAACGLEGPRNVEQRHGATVALSPDEVPDDLVSCSERYGELSEWPRPDAVYGVRDTSEVAVLAVDGRLACWSKYALLKSRPDFEGLAGLSMIASTTDDGNLVGESEEAPSAPGSDRVATTGDPNDSNPLPAAPPGGENADSNPLPARGSQGSWAANPAGDSNPLPAQPTDEEPMEHVLKGHYDALR